MHASDPLPSSPGGLPDRLAFLEAVHAAAPIMAALLNCEQQAYEYIDASVEQYLGYTAEEMTLSGPLFLASLLHPDDWGRVEPGTPGSPLPFAGWNPEKDPDSVDDGELRLRHRDGLWRWFHVRRKVFDWKPDGTPRRILATFQDITGRRRAEDRSLEAEERFRAVMKHSLDVINILDASGSLIYSSPAGERIHGFATLESLGLSLYPYIHPGDLSLVRQALALIVAHPDRPQTIQYRLASRNRGWVWVETVAVNQLQNPAIRGILCNIRDISDRKAAEESLLRSEALLAEAQHLASLGSFEFDLRTGESIWSPDLYRLLDRTPDLGPMRYPELIELIHPDDRRLWTSARKLLYSDSVPLRSEFRIVWKDGSVHHLVIKARPVLDAQGEGQKIVGAVQDISERKRIEEALRESMNAYREVADLLPQPVFEMDASGRLTFLNREGFAAFGYSEEDYDRGLQGLQMLVPEDRVRAAQDIARVLAGDASGHEYQALRKSGETFPVIIRSSPVVRNGRPVGLRGIVVDISERKRAEEERHQLQERLRHSEKMEAIGQLAGGIAHDFNNHLSAILGFSEVLAERLPDPELAQFTGGIIQACKRSAELTRQLLAFSRRGNTLTVLVDLRQMTDEVVQILKHSIDKRIVLRASGDGTPALVLGDPYELQSALMNLALNARDAMPEGGELAFSTRTTVLDADDCRRLPWNLFPGTYLELGVADTGTGIDPEVLPRIFEPFFTTKEAGKGTGLGLASVYGTVKNHRGAIEVESEPGKGTRFRILLPAAELEDGEPASPEAGEAPVPLPDFAPQSRQVLIVEDEELVGRMLLVMLRHLGIGAVLVPDGQAAVDYYRKASDRIDLIILDLVMPGMSARETFDALRTVRPDAKVVLSSGYSANGDVERLLEAGALAFIQKPYRAGALTRILAQVLG